MEEYKINNIKKQLNAGFIIKTYEYHCCGKIFTERIKFQEHLFHQHLDEYITHFSNFFLQNKNKTLGCNYVLPTKTNVNKNLVKERIKKNKKRANKKTIKPIEIINKTPIKELIKEEDQQNLTTYINKGLQKKKKRTSTQNKELHINRTNECKKKKTHKSKTRKSVWVIYTPMGNKR